MQFMKVLLRLLTALTISLLLPNSYASECIDTSLRPPVIELLEGVIIPRTKAIQDKEKFAKYYGQFSAQLAYIQDNVNPDTDEAIAYLINIHIGDQSLKDISCEAVRRGERMISLIKRYQQCLPQTGLEPLHDYFKSRSTSHADYVIRDINNKWHCDPEQ